MDLLSTAAGHARDIVFDAIKHKGGAAALVVFDDETPLARLLTDAYRATLPAARFEPYATLDKARFFAALDDMKAGDLVILIQSTAFRYDDFRIRIELFKRELAVIEHMHLERSTDDRQIALYVEGMAYDRARYVGLGMALKSRVDAAKEVTVECGPHVLRYEGGMEPCKLNVGDYTGMKNVGGTFPIGEVFSEPRTLELLNGSALLFGFAGTDHLVQIHEPFRIDIERGVLVRHEGPPAFQEVLDQISLKEAILVREFGLGLNRAFGPDRVLSDITAFERQQGLHFSLGEKHGVYKKPGFNPKKTRYHIDVFVAADRIACDGEEIYEKGEFTVAY
ncbi:MAG: hypothetical protein RLZZ324_748 [Candidatus Parcubacteria bacterium]|jgi:hypothetical protein